ncbi:hypothetical protein EDC94DRAFT_488977, partial [Helicostylum pulchrum]
MTNTAGFDLNRFQFHIELSNRYQALGSSEDTINADDIVEKYKDNKHLNLPKSRVIKSEEIQIRSGNWKRSKSLERKKKHTLEGKDISRIEKEISKNPLKHATNASDMKSIYEKQHQYRSQFRAFYFSKNQIRKTRSAEIRLNASKTNICNEERK